MALTTFLLEPLFHADVMLVTVLLLGLILDTRAGKSSSWKAVFFAVAVYVKDIPEEMVGAAEDDKLGKSSSLSLTAASWAEPCRGPTAEPIAGKSSWLKAPLAAASFGALKKRAKKCFQLRSIHFRVEAINEHDSSINKSYFQQLMMSLTVTFQEDNLNPCITISFN